MIWKFWVIKIEVIIQCKALRRNEVIFLTLFKVLWTCSLKSSCESKTIPKCVWGIVWMTKFWLKKRVGGFCFLVFLVFFFFKITSCAFFTEFRLKLIFHCKAQLLILAVSSSKSFVDKFVFLTTDKSEASSVNSFEFGSSGNR